MLACCVGSPVSPSLTQHQLRLDIALLRQLETPAAAAHRAKAAAAQLPLPAIGALADGDALWLDGPVPVKEVAGSRRPVHAALNHRGPVRPSKLHASGVHEHKHAACVLYAPALCSIRTACTARSARTSRCWASVGRAHAHSLASLSQTGSAAPPSSATARRQALSTDVHAARALECISMGALTAPDAHMPGLGSAHSLSTILARMARLGICSSRRPGWHSSCRRACGRRNSCWSCAAAHRPGLPASVDVVRCPPDDEGSQDGTYCPTCARWQGSVFHHSTCQMMQCPALMQAQTRSSVGVTDISRCCQLNWHPGADLSLHTADLCPKRSSAAAAD